MAKSAVSIEMGGRHVPTVFGLMNTWGNIGAFAFPFAVAWLVGEGSGANWNPVLFLFSGVYLAATLCWLAFDADGRIVEDEPSPTSPGERGASAP